MIGSSKPVPDHPTNHVTFLGILRERNPVAREANGSLFHALILNRTVLGLEQ